MKEDRQRRLGQRHPQGRGACYVLVQRLVRPHRQGSPMLMDIGIFHTPVDPVCRISQGHGVLLARAQSATHNLAVWAPRGHGVDAELT